MSLFWAKHSKLIISLHVMIWELAVGPKAWYRNDLLKYMHVSLSYLLIELS